MASGLRDIDTPDFVLDNYDGEMAVGPGGVGGAAGGEDDDDDDYEGQMVEVEPELFLESNMEEGDDVEGHESQLSNLSGAAAMASGALFYDSFTNDSTQDSTASNSSFGTRSMIGGTPGSRKTALGSHCPVCDQQLHKQHARDHVCWHFMDELKAMMAADPSRCPEPGCEYMGDKAENIARHLALFHSKLDEFLENGALVDEKRAKAMAKPRKVRS